MGSIHLCFRSRRHGRLQTHIPLQREKFPVKKTLPHRNILLSLFGSLFIFHVQRRSRLDYVAYCRRCPTIIYIDSHSASIQERKKISYSQPLPCRAPYAEYCTAMSGRLLSPSSPAFCNAKYREGGTKGLKNIRNRENVSRQQPSPSAHRR